MRADPIDKDTIVVGSLNCNSPVDKEFDTRKQTVDNLKYHDPDLLFFAGDQNYTHDEATYGWLQFGVQFAEVMKDRPTICILDDHDVGHPNMRRWQSIFRGQGRVRWRLYVSRFLCSNGGASTDLEFAGPL